jgi:two-component system, sensor histidine kinase and response regulator
VVDDNATNRLVLREILQGWGVKAKEARDAAEALDLLKEGAGRGGFFKLLILDGQMPGLDGFALAARIREDPALGCPRVIMLTSHGEVLDAEVARELGISAQLWKPVRRSSLLHAIHRAVGGRQAPTPASEEAALPTVPEPDSPPRALRILVVDDSEDNRELIRAYLKKTPHEAEFVENGQEAVERFHAGSEFDLVLMDIQMPVMDGHAATRAIRAWERDWGRQPTRIFALSAHALDEEVNESLDSGCDLHLTKPIRKSAFLHKISEVMNAVHRADTTAERGDSPQEER